MNSEHIELDKIPGAWVLTYWPFRRGPVLRLKITHTSFEDPNNVEAEVRFDASGPFIQVAAFSIAAYETEDGNDSPDTWNELPSVFTPEFKAMLRKWGKLSALMSLGGTRGGDRYAGEPHNSRDWFALRLDTLTDGDPCH